MPMDELRLGKQEMRLKVKKCFRPLFRTEGVVVAPDTGKRK